MERPLRVAIVVQRYGREVVGGAESHARALAGRLRGDLGWQVEAFTTTALDYRSWANHYPPGRALVDGIPVWRFDSAARRRRLLFGAYRRLAEPTARAAPLLESLWLRLQGPYSPALLDGIRRHARRFDRVLFFSYLYHPTVRGVGLVGDKAVLIPTAHDEPPLHFATTRRLFERCPLILANTEPERDLIRRVAPAARIEVAGLGFDDGAGEEDDGDSIGGGAAAEGPYLLYLGRISRGKGVAALVDQFLRARGRLGRGVVLRLAGQREDDVALPDTPAVQYLGRVSERRKRQLIRGALAVVNPSPHESMSMLVLEAIAAGVPVLVNRACPVLDSYARQVETCLGYDGEASFAAALAELARCDWRAPAARVRLERGQRWVRDRFSWQRVLDVFSRALTPSNREDAKDAVFSWG